MKRLVFLILTLTLAADDLVLQSGETLEGKIDRAATDAANKGKNNPNDIVIVLITDEKGTRRTVKNSDVKFIMPKKPSWEVRKENLEWYEKNKDKQKDTVPGMESFGRQCRAKGLDDQALLALHRAYELKAAGLKGTAEEHLQLAKWCHKNGLLEDESKEVRAALDIKRTDAKDVKAMLDLALWCKRNELTDEAMKIYEEILKTNPTEPKALAALKEVRESAEVKLREIVKQFISVKRAWSIKVAIEDAASPQIMEEWKKKLIETSQYIWEVTEGQFFIYEWTLEDQSSNGKVIVERGKLDWGGMNNKAPSGVLAFCRAVGTPAYEVHCPGKVWPSVLAHELFHGIFGLLDEYYQNPQCPCVMRSAPSPQRLCNSQTHLGGGRQREPCTDSVKKRYADVSFPNPAWTFTKTGITGEGGSSDSVEGEIVLGSMKVSAVPQCKVIVIDK